jgi:hypothetical protein
MGAGLGAERIFGMGSRWSLCLGLPRIRRGHSQRMSGRGDRSTAGKFTGGFLQEMDLY